MDEIAITITLLEAVSHDDFMQYVFTRLKDAGVPFLGNAEHCMLTSGKLIETKLPNGNVRVTWRRT